MRTLSRALILSLSLLVFFSCKKENNPNIDLEAQKIVSQVLLPDFPEYEVSILEFGGIPDGVYDNSLAFKLAFSNIEKKGGGTLHVPPGKYFTGPIHFKSNIELHLEEGSEILFNTDPNAYMPMVKTSYEGMELYNFSPLIYAYQVENIAITGKGVLNGQADINNWWPWAGKEVYGYKVGNPNQNDDKNLPSLREMNLNQVPVEERRFGIGFQVRPSFFEPFESERILISGVTIKNAPFWIVHPFKSSHFTMDSVTIISHGPNNDGCDPEYSDFVHINNCVFDTGDDCIAIKSGRNEDGRRNNILSQNIVIQNSVMKDGHGGVVMGSEISAGVKSVYVLNCEMDSPNLDRAIRLKSNTIRGGGVDGLYVKNIKIGQVKEAVLRINTHYGIYGIEEGEFYPDFKNIYLENIQANYGGKYGILIQGREELPVSGLHFKNVTIENTKKDPVFEFAGEVEFVNTTINSKSY